MKKIKEILDNLIKEAKASSKQVEITDLQLYEHAIKVGKWQLAHELMKLLGPARCEPEYKFKKCRNGYDCYDGPRYRGWISRVVIGGQIRYNVWKDGGDRYGCRELGICLTLNKAKEMLIESYK
jgi:hypothetical protein